MIRLRDVTRADKEKMRRWRNKPDIAKYMYTDHQISEAEHETWFQRMLADPTAKYWVIQCDGEDVGVVNLLGIDRRHQRCYWAFYLAEESVRGKGVGSFVEYSVLSHVFDSLHLRKLCCEVLDFNEPVIEMHKRFGFQVEGRLRAQMLKNGKPADVICLGMLREEWEQRKPELEQQLRKKGLLP